MKRSSIIIAVFAFGLLIALIVSCSTAGALTDAKSGAQLWGENCLRCHSSPAPETFSDVEWDVAMLHMHVRANLTDQEATKIADFLKSAN